LHSNAQKSPTWSPNFQIPGFRILGPWLTYAALKMPPFSGYENGAVFWLINKTLLTGPRSYRHFPVLFFWSRMGSLRPPFPLKWTPEECKREALELRAFARHEERARTEEELIRVTCFSLF
jgi:hypothetical protein